MRPLHSPQGDLIALYCQTKIAMSSNPETVLLRALDLQVGFKKTLTKEVAAFATDAKAFRSDWQANGPMVPGLAPLEAVERLKKFQQMFDVSALTSVQAVLVLTPHRHICPC